MEEIWKDIPGYEGLYQVSNLGNIRSLDRKAGHRFYKGQPIKPTTDNDGYLIIKLRKKGLCKYIAIHRLVAIVFIPNPYNLFCVNHKDENKTNNCVDNLEWCTREYNMSYGSCVERAKKTNTSRTGAPKKVIQYSLEGTFLNEYPSISAAAEINGFTSQVISRACHGKLKSPYGFIWRFEE